MSYKDASAFVSGASINELFELREQIDRKVEEKKNEGRVQIWRAYDDAMTIGFASNEGLPELLVFISQHSEDIAKKLVIEQFLCRASEVKDKLNQDWFL